MPLVLGINELYHDGSAALVEDGRLLGVVEEERLDRIKHTPGLCWGGDAPHRSVDWCLREFGIRDRDVDAVALSYRMTGYLAVKTIVDAVLANARRMRVRDILNQRVRSGDPAASVVYGNLGGYFVGRRRYLRRLRARFGDIRHVPHHRAHAASTFRMSGFDRANILVIDGLGEDHSTSLYLGDGDRIEGPFRTYSQYQSLGMLYKTVTFLLGFGYFGDGKTMGLASYGRFRPELGDLVTVGDGTYRIHLERIRKLSPYARAHPDLPLTRDHEDVARTVQDLLESAGVELAAGLHRRTGCRNLCLAGGVALNCNMNARLRAQPFVDSLFVQPGAMDMGSAIGAALEISAGLGAAPRTELEHVYYGPAFDGDEVERAIRARGLEARKLEDPGLIPEVAGWLRDGRIVGWFDGRMEFGPRALGHRSIVATPADVGVRDRVNRIKQRELWRPLAPSLLLDAAADWIEDAGPSPFMTLTFRFRPERARQVPGVVHVDGTARVQTVTPGANGRYDALIRAFAELTGIPMVMNTSFNRRSEPIVCTPAEAIDTYLATDLDCLVLGSHVLEKPS